MSGTVAQIDTVYVHRPSSTQERPSDHVKAKTSGTSAIVEPSLPSRGSTLGNDRSSHASMTAIIEDRSVSLPTHEVNFKFSGTVFPLGRNSRLISPR